MAFHTRRVDFLHKRIVHKKFQLKIPTLSKNDCSATWKPNTYQKYDTCGKVRNVQRYQKYVVILRSFIFIVSDIFKPTVCLKLHLKCFNKTLHWYKDCQNSALDSNLFTPSLLLKKLKRFYREKN